MGKKFLLLATLALLFIAGMIYYELSSKQEKERPSEVKEEPKEKSLEEIIQDLTAPAAKELPPVPKESLRNLTAPPTKPSTAPPPVSEDILKSLSAPAP